MGEGNGQFSCLACGRAYAWKPEYAGRRVKCKCGSMMTAPPVAPGAAAAAPRAAAAAAKVAASAARPAAQRPVAAVKADAAPPPPSLDELAAEFEQAFTGAEYDVAPPPPAATPQRARPVTVAPTAMAAAATGTVPTSPILGYGGTVRRRNEDEADVLKASRVSDFYVPLALIVVGLGASILDAYLWGLRNPVYLIGYVGITTVLNLAMVFVALLAAVKLMDLGLGSIGPALLKITAVAILPGAVSGIISHYTMGMMTWSISAICYYILLYSLFEMDSTEMMVTTTIIWGIRFFINLFLLVAIVRFVGGALHSTGGAGGASGSGSGSEIVDPDDASGPSHERTQSPAETDREAAREIQNGKAVEAREWLAPSHNDHIGFKVSKKGMLELTEKFYAAGATHVYAAGLDTMGAKQVCALLYVEMPDAPDARRAIIKIDDELNEAEEPSKDNGARYLHVSLD